MFGAKPNFRQQRCLATNVSDEIYTLGRALPREDSKGSTVQNGTCLGDIIAVVGALLRHVKIGSAPVLPR